MRKPCHMGGRGRGMGDVTNVISINFQSGSFAEGLGTDQNGALWDPAGKSQKRTLKLHETGVGGFGNALDFKASTRVDIAITDVCLMFWKS